MIEFENVEVFGFEAAIRGMRNPLNSWDKSDSTVVNAVIMEKPNQSIVTSIAPLIVLSASVQTTLTL